MTAVTMALRCFGHVHQAYNLVNVQRVQPYQRILLPPLLHSLDTTVRSCLVMVLDEAACPLLHRLLWLLEILYRTRRASYVSWIMRVGTLLIFSAVLSLLLGLCVVEFMGRLEVMTRV